MANMTIKDRNQLAWWLAGGATLAEVLAVERFGLVDNERFTPAAVRAFTLAWEWSTHRFGGRIGARQDMLHAKHGPSFLARRYARCQRLVQRFIGS